MKHAFDRRDRQQLTFTRNVLVAGAFTYLFWWFAVESLLPYSFNPLGSRLAIIGLMLILWVATYFSPHARRHLMSYFTLCMCGLTTHYFYLMNHNPVDVNWVVGCYITVIAVSACIQNSRALLTYSIFVVAGSLVLIINDAQLRVTVFLPGIITVSIFSNIGVRFRLKFLSQLTASSHRTQSLFDAAFEGIILHDQGLISEVNYGFANIFRYETDEIIGKSY